MRQLSKYAGEVRYFSARVGGSDKFNTRVCLENVQCVTGESKDDHVWVEDNKSLTQGKCVTFRALVTEYIRPSTSEKDYTLEKIREVKEIS